MTVGSVGDGQGGAAMRFIAGKVVAFYCVSETLGVVMALAGKAGAPAQGGAR